MRNALGTDMWLAAIGCDNEKSLDSSIDMTRIVTSDEFVTLILATLKLRYGSIDLLDADLDRGLQDAYEDLSLEEDSLRVSSNFTFFPDPLHGNSTKLRRAILWARDRGFLESKQDKRDTKYAVSMSDQLANHFLKSAALGRAFLDGVVDRRFPIRRNTAA